jgi:hypothetical protein
MKKFASRKVKSISSVLVLLIGIVGLGAVSAPARAASCPYPVADQTDNDKPKTNIRLISPVLTDDNSIRRYDFESQWTNDCDWFGVGMRYKQVYVPFGLTTNLTYHVTDAVGAPLTNTVLGLRVNKGYSNSNAPVRVNGIRARPAPSNASDGANVQATTDINGNATFVVQSPVDCELYGGTLPPAPRTYDSDTPLDSNADPTTDCFSEIMPSITGEKTDSTDWVKLHYFDSSKLIYSPSPGNATLQVPSLGEYNSINTSSLVQAYTLVGAGQIVAYSFTDAADRFLRNRTVQVRINAEGSGSNAQVTAALIGLDGQAQTSTASSSEVVVTGLTDAFGTLTFYLKNSDQTGEVRPPSLTSPVPTSNRRFSTLVPQIPGNLLQAKPLEFHFVSGLKMPGQSLSAPSNVRVSAEGLNVTVSWTNDPENEGLVGNDVFDSNDNIVCSTGEGQSCTFTWDLSRFQQIEKYYVVPRTATISGPASSVTPDFAPATLKPVLYGPARNFSVGETVSLLALGFPSNTQVLLRDGTQSNTHMTNANGSVSLSYQIQKTGITSLSLRAGSKSATLKLYSPRDKVTVGLCKVGNSIKVSYVALLPNSTVDLQVSDGRDVISATADAKGNASVTIACLQVGGYIWNATTGSVSLNSGGFTVR